jgi:uncharacterized sulfatase
MEGRDFLTGRVPPRTHVFASRDRCDETEDLVRAVRDDRFKLIRNHDSQRSYAGRNDYTRRAFLEERLLLEARDAGTLTPVQAIWLAGEKPQWEFYDLDVDPLELVNRYGDPSCADDIARLKLLLETWTTRTDAANPATERLEHIVPEKAHEQVRAQREAERAAAPVVGAQ